jgi:hypothetical protein
VFVAGHDAFGSLLTNYGRNRLVVCGNDDGISDVHLRDSLPDPDYKGKSGKETEWFAGKAQGAKTRRNYY